MDRRFLVIIALVVACNSPVDEGALSIDQPPPLGMSLVVDADGVVAVIGLSTPVDSCAAIFYGVDEHIPAILHETVGGVSVYRTDPVPGLSDSLLTAIWMRTPIEATVCCVEWKYFD